MKHNEKTTKAIEESIAHHEKNLHDLETLKGEFKRLGHSFYVNEIEISFAENKCALCVLFSTDCLKCPLALAGFDCNKTDSPWETMKYSKTCPEAIEATKGMIKALRRLVEEEFKVGDDVTVKEAYTCDSCRGLILKVVRTSSLSPYSIIVEGVRGYRAREPFIKEALVKVPPLSPHTKLKARIDTITCDTSLGEVDDVMRAIYGNEHPTKAFRISIPFTGEESDKGIKVMTSFDDKELQYFIYKSQLQKVSAIKQALTWLLEKSDLVTCPECKGSTLSKLGMKIILENR